MKVDTIFWRAITRADYFNIERDPNAVRGGGGQRYISISFTGITPRELGKFLTGSDKSLEDLGRPSITLTGVMNLYDPLISADLTFAARYRLPHQDNRYRITNQNRHRGRRHPAWTSRWGFPESDPSAIQNARDKNLSDVDGLAIFVARSTDGQYAAGFVWQDRPIDLASHGVSESLRSLYESSNGVGIINIPAEDDLTFEKLRQLTATQQLSSNPLSKAVQELDQIVSEIESLSVKPSRGGQGRSSDAQYRQAVESYSMKIVTRHFTAAGWAVSDVSANSPYDLECRMGELRRAVEVKGTSGAGTEVFLTANEVEYAEQNYPESCLAIVSDIEVDRTEFGEYVCCGGQLKIVHPWLVSEAGNLRPLAYKYELIPPNL